MSRFRELPPHEQATYRLVLRQMLRLAGGYAVPIMFGDPAWKEGHLSGATGFVVRTPSEHLLITASHVLAGYETFSSEHLESIWQVGNLGFDPGGRVALRNRKADVVAVRLSQAEAEKVGSSIASCPHGWPPPSPEVGDHVVMSGFPRRLRDTSRPGHIGSGPLSMFLRVDSVGDDYFYCQVEREELIDCNEEDLLPENSDFGGWSGSPILLTEDLAYPVVALVSEYQTNFGLLRAATLAALVTNHAG
jgi:hypothetical protein